MCIAQRDATHEIICCRYLRDIADTDTCSADAGDASHECNKCHNYKAMSVSMYVSVGQCSFLIHQVHILICFLIFILFQRNLRCYNIAKLYFMLGEYELTRRYVSNYLTVREDSASAHKLLGQALENLGQKEKALAQYKCSLELESKQQDLVLKGKDNWTRF